MIVTLHTYVISPVSKPKLVDLKLLSVIQIFYIFFIKYIIFRVVATIS